jgi:hypothetical protein
MADTISEAFRDATERLHARAEDLRDRAHYQVRKNAPRAQRALSAGYDEAEGAIRSLASNRAAQAWVAAGAAALIIGVFLFRRK